MVAPEPIVAKNIIEWVLGSNYLDVLARLIFAGMSRAYRCIAKDRSRYYPSDLASRALGSAT